MTIVGDAEGILSRVVIDPGVGIRRLVRVCRRDIRHAASDLQARLRVLVHGSRLLLAMYAMRPRVHIKPVRGAQGRDMWSVIGAGTRLVLLVDQEKARSQTTSLRSRHLENALAVVRADGRAARTISRRSR